MGRRSDGLSGKILGLAAVGGVMGYDSATAALFGEPATKADRVRVVDTVANLVSAGRLVRVRRGAFALPDPAAPVEPLPADEECAEDARMVPSAGEAVQRRLNRLALVLNAAHEELAELRHDLRVAETFEEARPSFPMRCAEPWEREP